MESVSKTCVACRESKPLGEFYLKRGKPRSICKTCHCAVTNRDAKIRKDPALSQQRERERIERECFRQANRPTELVCCTCGETKPVTAFRQHRRTCRACNFAADDPGSVKQRQTRYRERHAEELRERGRTRYKNDPRYGPEVQRRWRERRPDLSAAAAKRYRVSHPEVNRVICQRRRARKVTVGGAFTVEDWARLKAHYDWHCLGCGRREPDVTLQADHVVPLALGGWNIISNIQPLCVTCNQRKNARFIDYRPDFP